MAGGAHGDVLVRLVAVRHGETTLNAGGRLTGQLDPPLTARGRGQARALAPLVSGPFDVIAHSGSARTAETLALARPGVASGAEVDVRWRERSFGTLEGAPRERWTQPADLDVAPPRGESYRALAVRVEGALEALRARARAADRPLDVLLVAHSGVLRALTALAAGGPPSADAFLRPGAGNGALIRLAF